MGGFKRKWIILGGIALFLCCIGIWIALPSNYYLRQTIIHFFPTIDQYPIFENRTVKAGSPQPWNISEDYNKLAIPDKYTEDFDEYGTIAFVIIQNGELLFEQYWDNYSNKSHSNSFSMAKSIISIAIGCAIDDGLIRSIDQPVSDFFPQFSGYNGKALTIKNLLTMSAGLDFQESYSSIFSPTTQLYYGNDLGKIVFGMKEVSEPGINFIYQSGVTQLLAYILEKATDENVSSYVSRKIWTPIHAEEDALWSLDHKEGIEKAYCCFNTNARDFARLGQLVLNDGSWNDTQIVSKKYIETATSADSSLIFKKYEEQNNNYGCHFWILHKNGMKIPYFRGMIGQYIFIIPEKNAIVVRLGKKQSNHEDEKEHYPKDVDVWLDAAFDILDKTPKRAKLVFGGDLMQHMPQIYAAKKDSVYDFSESFQYIKPIFEKADIAFVNLETTLNDKGYYSGFPLFRAPAEIAKLIKTTGIDVAVMANNHVFDGGKQGLITTLALLDSAKIKHTGAFADTRQFIKDHPLMLQANGLKFALLNYTYGTNGLPTPEGTSVNRIDTFEIANDIANIDRSKIDGIIIFFHWGNEYMRKYNDEQKALSDFCHNHGVEIVIGSHPHVIQPIEEQCDSDGLVRNITVYSLGNLVSNQRERYKNGGIIVELDIEKEFKKPLKIKASYTPVWVLLPKYRILPPNVADTISMTTSDRTAYELFVSDTKKLLEN